MEKIIEIIKTIRQNKGILEPFQISENTSLRNDLAFDSFDLAEFTVRIEDEFGIDIFQTGLIENIADVKKKLKL